MAGADERVNAHVRRIEDCADRRDDRYVIAEDGKIVDALSLGSQKRQRGRRSRGLKSDGKKHHVLVRIHKAVNSL